MKTFFNDFTGKKIFNLFIAFQFQDICSNFKDKETQSFIPLLGELYSLMIYLFGRKKSHQILSVLQADLTELLVHYTFLKY